MNIRTVAFLVILCFLIGLIIGASKKTRYESTKPRPAETITVHDTIVRVQRDTIRIPVKQVKYYTKTDTVRVRDSVITVDCVTFPLLLSDSSIIAVNGCSALGIPRDLALEAEWVDKREHIRTIERVRTDTVQLRSKRLGFTLGPSAGVGIDINNVSRPAYFIGCTLTYGWRF